jgi:hypothetical protein
LGGRSFEKKWEEALFKLSQVNGLNSKGEQVKLSKVSRALPQLLVRTSPIVPRFSTSSVSNAHI